MNFKSLSQLATLRPLILGSSSPRRLRLLRETGIEFTQVIPDLEEAISPGESAYDYARRLAEDKAKHVGRLVTPESVVIGCDTIVVLKGRILEKPANRKDAFEILSSLAGNMHTVCSAVALLGEGGIIASGYDLTDVYFNAATGDQIREYIATGEPMDKAGAYGIQGKGAFLVDTIKGELDTVIGLPRRLLDNLARETVRQLQLHG